MMRQAAQSCAIATKRYWWPMVLASCLCGAGAWLVSEGLQNIARQKQEKTMMKKEATEEVYQRVLKKLDEK